MHEGCAWPLPLELLRLAGSPEPLKASAGAGKGGLSVTERDGFDESSRKGYWGRTMGSEWCLDKLGSLLRRRSAGVSCADGAGSKSGRSEGRKRAEGRRASELSRKQLAKCVR